MNNDAIYTGKLYRFKNLHFGPAYKVLSVKDISLLQKNSFVCDLEGSKYINEIMQGNDRLLVSGK